MRYVDTERRQDIVLREIVYKKEYQKLENKQRSLLSGENSVLKAITRILVENAFIRQRIPQLNIKHIFNKISR